MARPGVRSGAEWSAPRFEVAIENGILWVSWKCCLQLQALAYGNGEVRQEVRFLAIEIPMECRPYPRS
jgi:hypothetical protein